MGKSGAQQAETGSWSHETAMIIILLDPNTYCYTNEEWAGGDALDRLDKLLNFITEIDDSENILDAHDLVSFLLPDDVLARSFSMNPTANQPPNNFYHRMFTSQVLPALMRRRKNHEFSPPCGPALSERVYQDDCVADADFMSFLSEIDVTEAHSIIYAYHEQRVSLKIPSELFQDDVPINSVHGRFFVCHRNMFPLEEKKNTAASIHEAICVLKEKLGRFDPTWNDFQVASIFLHDDFLPSVAKSNFREFVYDYQERIIFSLLQVATSRSVTTKEHSMKPQKVMFRGQSYGKWNAYVFQNGPSDRDTRCSRLYFAKVSGGVLLFMYDEDAH